MRGLLTLCLLSSVHWPQEGKLDAVRSTVREEREPGDDDADSDTCDDIPWDGHERGEEDGGFVEWWTERIILAPFTLPRLVLEDEGVALVYFQEYPGARGAGYWIPAPEDGIPPRRWSTQARMDAGSDGDDLERFGGGLRIEHATRLGLDFSFDRWTEDLAAGATDELWLGDANLIYRFANSASTVFRIGAGMNWLADGGEEDFGFDFTYGAEWFFGSALELCAELDLGNLNAADFAHVRLGLGILLGRAALTLAYDGYDIGGIDLTSVSFGLAAWF